MGSRTYLRGLFSFAEIATRVMRRVVDRHIEGTIGSNPKNDRSSFYTGWVVGNTSGFIFRRICRSCYERHPQSKEESWVTRLSIWLTTGTF